MAASSTLAVFLWIWAALLSNVHDVDGVAAGVNNILADNYNNNGDQCTVSLLVKLALQTQEQSQRLNQLETRLKEQSDHIKQQAARIDGQETRLQEQTDQIKQQAARIEDQETRLQDLSQQLKQKQEEQQSDVRVRVGRLEEKLDSLETGQERTAADLTQLGDQLKTGLATTLKEQQAQLRSLAEDRVKPVESLLERNVQTLAALNESQAQQGEARERLSVEVRGLLERVQSVESAQDMVRADLTAALNNSRSRDTQAFRASLTHSQLAANVPIVFQPEFANGTGYDNVTGIYTVPTPGIYLFGFQLFPSSHENIIYDLFVSGVRMIRSRCDDLRKGATTSCASFSLLRLRRGDTVHVQPTGAAQFYGIYHSFFYGALIFADA